jgi:CRP-like cAMP-binding protein
VLRGDFASREEGALPKVAWNGQCSDAVVHQARIAPFPLLVAVRWFLQDPAAVERRAREFAWTDSLERRFTPPHRQTNIETIDYSVTVRHCEQLKMAMKKNVIPFGSVESLPASSGREPALQLVAPSNFLAQLGSADYADLCTLGVLQRYQKDDLVFPAGVPGDRVYFLKCGRVKIYQLSPLGRTVILWFCFPGEIFGLAEVAQGGGRVVNAQACEPSEVLAVTQEQFKQFIATHPEAALLSMKVLSSRLRILGEILVNLVSDDVNIRIAKLILRLSARYGARVGKDIFLNIPLTHQEIADMVGTTRQTATSALSALKRQGVLSIDNRRIHIESEELLSEIIQQG